ncbi:hypothetical protein BDK51DRAFT_37556 [Blyttiomyces helicus]|uniref:Uncharacterized protein n=1 Tax=Blyttiomyces helicus TaxID=388810 RepID=A0A4P9VY01_9FUNG|nr:hypothetical protein BDK51DRAFT_52883 [Blyttiomyces helicus]RKO84624.1 hypothetical protein BDK51DRAFT_37556 [Blyttiomyces helicus]|eukprot:RKO83915.1 hypothetical protein BDK51DRAFT_52883 [Blyttiomyces helicus]
MTKQRGSLASLPHWQELSQRSSGARGFRSVCYREFPEGLAVQGRRYLYDREPRYSDLSERHAAFYRSTIKPGHTKIEMVTLGSSQTFDKWVSTVLQEHMFPAPLATKPYHAFHLPRSDGTHEEVRFSNDDFARAFEHGTAPFIRLIREQLDAAKLKGYDCKHTFLVGGFSSFPFMESRIKHEFDERMQGRIYVQANAEDADGKSHPFHNAALLVADRSELRRLIS